MKLGMAFKKVLERLTLVGRKIINDDMDFFAGRLISNDIGEEGDEFCLGVSGGILTEYLTGLRVERRRGEEEILKRFERGAIKGLRLLHDHRSEGQGYDFLCEEVKGKRRVELELKTYKSLDGQIVLTPKEFERARTGAARYYLLGPRG